MKMPVIDITPEEATAKLAEYEAAIAEERNREDLAIAAGYRAAARGHGVISLPTVIAAGGYFSDGLPKLAVCRADARQCFVRWDGPDLLFYDADRYDSWQRQNRGALLNDVSVRVAAGNRPPVIINRAWHATTIVPLIPPRHRPRRRPRRLSAYHVLWEVEKWERIAPRDPALIRHIRGDLWAVLAVWDLTDLERSVLSQR